MKRALLILLVLCAGLAAAQTTVHVTGAIPGVTQTQSATITWVSPTNLAFSVTGFSSMTAGASGTLTMTMAASNPARPSPLLPAAFQFNLTWTAADWTSVAVSLPANVTNLGKSASCNTPTTTLGLSTMTCIVAGLSPAVIPPGSVALIQLTSSATPANKTSNLTFNNFTASNTFGNAMPNITMPLAPLSIALITPFTVALSQTVIEQGENVAGTVTLGTAAPMGGTQVTLTTDAGTKIVLPATMPSIPAGATAVSFQITGGQ